MSDTERDVKRGIRTLSVVLAAEELAVVAQEMARITVAREDAEAEIEAIKSEMKEKVEGAKGKVAQLTSSLNSKARVLREGRVERDVPVTMRVSWEARRYVMTRDDTGAEVESRPATQEELDALCTWITDGPKRRLIAPDGVTQVREQLLSPDERQAVLPLSGDAESTEDAYIDGAPAGRDRVWMHKTAFAGLDHREQSLLEQPDPKGPRVEWHPDGDYVRADVPTTILSQVEAQAKKAEARVFTQARRPTLADLRAQTDEEPTRLNPKARKGVLPPKN